MTERAAEAGTQVAGLSTNNEPRESQQREAVSNDDVPASKAGNAGSQVSGTADKAVPSESDLESHRGSLTPTGPQPSVSEVLTTDQSRTQALADKGPDYFNFPLQPQESQDSTEQTLNVTIPATSTRSVASSHNPTPQEQALLIDVPNASSAYNRISPQNSRPPTSDPATTRPVSIAELPTRPGGEPQSIPEHDHALSEVMVSSVTSPAHASPSSRITRTHSSHSSHFSHSSIRESPVKDVIHGYSGARTAGNTPAQSPGFDSTSVRSPLSGVRKYAHEAEDGRPGSQILQPTNHQAPIETHKLNKDIDPVSGRKSLNHYQLIEKLGSGQHGTVKRGINTQTNEFCAVKIVRRFTKKARLGRTGDPSEFIKKEVAILKKARHPHVVSLFEVIDDPEFDKVYLVLEYVERSEIVWRKAADTAIGLFERDRVAREHMEGYDVHSEHGAIDEFNRGVEARRKDKEDLLARQKRDAWERLQQPERRRSIFWNPELSAHVEHEDAPGLYHGGLHDNMRLSRADQHAVDHPGDVPQSATPLYTTKALSHALNTQFSNSQPSSQPTSAPSSVPPSQPPSRPVSRPTSPRLPDGSMYSPYVEDRSPSDLEFQQVLQQIIEEESDPWPSDAEAFKHVPCLTLSQASDAFRDTVLGIEYLHYQGIIHRDIKPANLLWTRDYRVKISDFGVSYLGKPVREDSEHEDLPAPENSQHDEDIELAKTVGTPAFYAPELCDPDNFDPDKRSERPAITGQIDVWALGVTLYCMVFGRLPFFDFNEFRMYEKIAREEVFIPRVRLMGVSHTDKTPSDQYKRLDDVLEYEEVDDTLSDLLRRLLVKDPSKRITLMEVKRHPWVIGGIQDKEKWLEETDPSRQSEGRKIEVSNEEVQEAVVGLNLFDSLVKGVQRIGSVFRGRSSRKRGLSNPKSYEPSSSAASPRFPEDRRSSLRGDEQIVAALKHSHGSRESEHPLSHSVAASPGYKSGREYFGVDKSEERPKSALEVLERHRPSVPTSRTISTADSMKTVTARESAPRLGVTDQRTVSAEDFTSTTHAIDYNSSSSSIGGILGGAGRRIAYSFRSRERGGSQHSPSQTSRSSSVDTNLNANVAEDYRASPSLGISSAIAAGHVDPPPALRENEQYNFPAQSSTESLYVNRPRDSALRRTQGEMPRLAGGHRRSVSYAPEVQTHPSDDDILSNQQRPASAAESSLAISSSSDQIVSGDSAAHSRIPSVVSRASSVSATIEEEQKPFAILHPPKPFSSSTERPYSAASLDETISADPATAKARAAQQEEEAEAGYNGGEEGQDSDSEDEGLSMA